MKAFWVDVEGVSKDSLYAGETAGKVRAHVMRVLVDLDYTRRPRFDLIKVRRAAEFDDLAVRQSATGSINDLSCVNQLRGEA